MTPRGVARAAMLVLGVSTAMGGGTGDEAMIRLENAQAKVTFAAEGGALIGFQPAGDPINPLSWALTAEDMPATSRGGAPFRGHFLCFGRWGSPSPGEIAAGVPHNGEPAARTWQVFEPRPSVRGVRMQVDAPVEQWTVRRDVRLSARSALLHVEETFENLQSTARFTAIVQHATLGPPFLNPHTRIDCNAGAGFNQALVKDGIIGHPYRWPNGVSDDRGSPLDLRRCEGADGYVSTHVIDEDLGWVTAASPDAKWMIGYLWDAREYPWLHLWHGMRDGRLWARGLEFGTTGLGDTVTPEVRATTRFEGRHNLLFVDARASVTREYRVFLLPIPADFIATRAVARAGDAVVVEFDTASGPQRSTLAWGD